MSIETFTITVTASELRKLCLALEHDIRHKKWFCDAETDTLAVNSLGLLAACLVRDVELYKKLQNELAAHDGEVRTMSREFDAWIRMCEELDVKVARLEGAGETALYKTWREIEPSFKTNWVAGRENTMFHVWVKGGRQLMCEDYQQAYAAWERAQGEN